MFITFEGPEGGGKSTQIAILAKRLEDSGIETLVTRQPGGEALGKQLRSIMLDHSDLVVEPVAELLLMMADRAQSVKTIIEPALNSGITVLCDRYCDSSIAYQGYGRGLQLGTVAKLNEIATGGLLPDLTFLLDLDPEIGLRRQKERTRFEDEHLAFHRKVRQGYLMLAIQQASRFRWVDASGDLETVSSAIWSHYETHRGNRA